MATLTSGFCGFESLRELLRDFALVAVRVAGNPDLPGASVHGNRGDQRAGKQDGGARFFNLHDGSRDG